MNKIMKAGLLIPLALALSAGSALAADDDSLLKKGAKVKVYDEMDSDSTLKKAVRLDATGDVLKDDDASGAEKAIKLKVLDEASE